MTEKIQPTHLERTAYVYVRQSTAQKVRHHQESQQRQYALADHAQRLGFHRTQVIDGRPGSGSQERPGFARLLAAVCEGAAGAVFALEASRLARNNRDWHHLVDLCALTDTLLVDYDGVYDPRLLNDRLLLGLKGTMSEFELGLMKQRASAARTQMIQRGAVLWDIPAGCVRSEGHEIEMIPNRQVQKALRGVFAKFREMGSARQVTIWYREEQIPLPHLRPGTRGPALLAGLLRCGRCGRKLQVVYSGNGGRLILRGRADVTGGGEMRQEPGDLGLAQFHRVPLAGTG